MVKARRPVDEQSAAEPASEGITPQGDPRGNAFSAAQISAQREPFGLDRVSVLESFSELMGEDLTGVSLQTGSAGVGATGVARGEHVTVASSADPFDPEGLALIGHELVHVLQQRKGRVDPEHPDPELEIEAETLGRKAAAGIPVRVAAGSLPRAVAPQHFRPQDWVKTLHYDETKLATGLTSREKGVADRLVADAKALVAPWDEARLDPEEAFDPTPLENAFRGAKREWILETGLGFDEIESYVVAELRLTGFELKGVEITTELPMDTHVLGDEPAIIGVLINLLSNAALALTSAAREQPCVSLRGEHQGDRLWLRVRDNGTGIAPENLGRVLEPFFTTRDVGAGLGLGLSMSYGIIQRHGGTLSVNSEHGAWTEFSLDLATPQH